MYDELILKLREDAEFLKISSRYNNTKNEFAERILQAVGAIESTSKAYQMMTEAYESDVTKHCWIPVTESLPCSDDCVIVTYIVDGDINDRRIDQAFYDDNCDDGMWVLSDDGIQAKKEVIAWMPCPKPYSGTICQDGE